MKVCSWGGAHFCYCCLENQIGRAKMQELWEKSHDTPWTGPKFKPGRGHRWNARLQSETARLYDRSCDEEED